MAGAVRQLISSPESNHPFSHLFLGLRGRSASLPNFKPPQWESLGPWRTSGRRFLSQQQKLCISDHLSERPWGGNHGVLKENPMQTQPVGQFLSKLLPIRSDPPAGCSSHQGVTPLGNDKSTQGPGFVSH